MTDHQVLKIAAMVSELGKLRVDSKMPTDEQAAIIRDTCGLQTATDALYLSLGVVLEAALPTADGVARPMLDLALVVASLMAECHRERKVRRVTRGEVLRMIADAADREDATIGRINDGLSALIEAASVKPAKPGSN